MLCAAQIDLERAAVSRMQKGKWAAAQQTIRKALNKDSLNVEAQVLYGEYFFAAGNPRYNIDSAHYWVTRAGQSFEGNRGRQRTHADSATIASLHVNIDSAAFERAKAANSQTSYEYFITHYADADHLGKAIELRDELAYVEALRENSAAGFRRYMEKFPASLRYADAAARYEHLVFDERTTNQKISEWKKFRTDFPGSAYMSEVEKKIFEVSTASGNPKDFIDFINNYTGSPFARKAGNILFYITEETGESIQAGMHYDSLVQLSELNEGYWVPYFHNGKYGFLDADGKPVMEAQFESIDSTYLCGNVLSDYLITSSGLISRAGVKLFSKTAAKADDLGFGFLLINDGRCSRVVHKSGFLVGDDCIGEAKVVAGRFLAVKQGTLWALFAFNGLRILDARFEDISAIDHVILFKRSGKSIAVRDAHLKDVADLEPFDDAKVFDDVRAWGEGNLLVRNGVLEGVLNQALEFIIPLDRHSLSKTSFGFIETKDGKLKLHGVANLEQETFDAVRNYGEWLDLTRGNQRSIFRVSTSRVVATGLDSVWIRSGLIFSRKADSILVFVRQGNPVAVHQSSPVTFITGRDTVVYFWVPEKKGRAVFNAATGTKLFNADFEDIQSLGQSLFIFEGKDRKGVVKKGIIQADGRIVQPAEYDAIIPANAGYLSLLKGGKFGLYDTRQRLLIKTSYERNVAPYSDRYFVAYQGGYGIIGRDEKPVTGFEFDEIRYWNDSAAWVKKNYQWSIYQIATREVKLARIRNFQVISNSGTEQVVRVQQDNHFGVVSNVNGIIIPLTFNDVINLGSEEKPLYFTEKRVEEAGIYVVIYYTSKGKFIRKQVYEDEEYSRIYCDN